MLPGTEKTTTTNPQTRALPVSPVVAPKAAISAGHAGIYRRVDEIISGGGASDSPPADLVRILRSAEFSDSVNDLQKARAVQFLQRGYGNQYVQRMVAAAAP